MTEILVLPLLIIIGAMFWCLFKEDKDEQTRNNQHS